jgi:hypothetical protein
MALTSVRTELSIWLTDRPVSGTGQRSARRPLQTPVMPAQNDHDGLTSLVQRVMMGQIPPPEFIAQQFRLDVRESCRAARTLIIHAGNHLVPFVEQLDANGVRTVDADDF